VQQSGSAEDRAPQLSLTSESPARPQQHQAAEKDGKSLHAAAQTPNVRLLVDLERALIQAGLMNFRFLIFTQGADAVDLARQRELRPPMQLSAR
jgi:hypothetical protein